MLSLTSATSGYSATSTSSFKVRTQIKRPLLSNVSMVITPASLLWAHTFVFMPHRRVTVCWRSWQRWRRFETFCAGRWTRCRNTLTAALTPWPKTSSRETGVSRRCVWERWGYPIYFMFRQRWTLFGLQRCPDCSRSLWMRLLLQYKGLLIHTNDQLSLLFVLVLSRCVVYYSMCQISVCAWADLSTTNHRAMSSHWLCLCVFPLLSRGGRWRWFPYHSLQWRIPA